MILAAVVIVAFVLDMMIGDPLFIPHPVVAIGKGISSLERCLRRTMGQTPESLRRAGLVLAIVIPLITLLAAAALIILLALIHPVLALVAECWLCYQTLATRELCKQSTAVANALEADGIVAARNAVGRIVGRDTEQLDERGVIKATVETIAENTTDGVIAPLLFMTIGGAPLGLTYKAVNTLDSMVAYKNDHYIDFGRASAKLDDGVNYIPARITALLMIASCPIVGLPARRAYSIWRRDRRNHASPNSAQTESVVAGALGVQLAGDASYFGKTVSKPSIGDSLRSIEVSDIKLTNRLMIATAVLALVIFVLIRIGIVFAVMAVVG